MNMFTYWLTQNLNSFFKNIFCSLPDIMYILIFILCFFKKVMKMLIAVVVLFLCCWGPIMTNDLLVAFKVIDKLNTGKLKQIRQALYNMAYFNSCINPFLYAFMSKNFRNAFKQTCSLIYCRPRPVMQTRQGSFIRYSFQSRSTSFISGKFVDCRENTTISKESTTLSIPSYNKLYQSQVNN